MPNLVDNCLVVRGRPTMITRFLENHMRAAPWSEGALELDFGSIIPVDGYRSADAMIAAWGTKGNARDTVVLARGRNEVEVNFTTPWTMPEPVYRRLGRLYFDLSFVIEAIDPDLWAIEGRVEGERADFREVPDFASVFARFYGAPDDAGTAINGHVAGSDPDPAAILIRTIERKYR